MSENYQLTFSIVLATLLVTMNTCNAQSPRGVDVSVDYIAAPLFKGVRHNAAAQLRIFVPEGQSTQFTHVNLQLDDQAVEAIKTVEIYKCRQNERAFDGSDLVGSAGASREVSISVDLRATPGLTFVWVAITLKAEADADSRPAIQVKSIVGVRGRTHSVSQEYPNGYSFRIGIAFRKPGDDNVHTYRIPGLVTTEAGTLIAVYDIRHNNSRDLPGNVDVGMSRSTDGGRTWEPMKTIMDMGPPHDNNGIGDPAILFDPKTNTLWVAALWSKGNRSIAGSEPGLSPEVTGQFVLASSKDDGFTWSAPVNITTQVKDPKWHLYFQGPGSGIAMEDGTLVFPSQYWDESKKPGIPHAAIIYSKDHGRTWKSGRGAKPNTTESQVIETKPGVLMLNMRDNRGGFRSIATTQDLGETWVEHHTSQKALPDPVCMASLIKANVNTSSGSEDVVFFSNVANAAKRKDTTVKASLDLGESWSKENELLLDDRQTYGYSSLARIDKDMIGIVYEGVGEMYFVRIPVKDIIK